MLKYMHISAELSCSVINDLTYSGDFIYNWVCTGRYKSTKESYLLIYLREARDDFMEVSLFFDGVQRVDMSSSGRREGVGSSSKQKESHKPKGRGAWCIWNE